MSFDMKIGGRTYLMEVIDDEPDQTGVKIDEAAFHAAAEQFRAEQLAVSTSSVLVGVMRNESSPLDARFADCVSSSATDLVERAAHPGAPGCRFCGVAYTRNFTEYQMQIWDDERGVQLAKFHVCAAERCRIHAEKDVGDARLNVERRRRLAVERMAISTSGIPVAKAPTPEQLPAIRARLDEIRREPSQRILLDADPPPPRPDGFAQSQVDAAKAALLAHVPRRGAK